MRVELRASLGVILVLMVPGALAWITGRAYLPRHSAAHDLPWARSPAGPVHDEPDNPQLADKLRVIHPDYVFNARKLRRGDFPLWNSQIFGGVPHAANPMTAVFYPPNWLHPLVPEVDVPLVAATVHLLLGGLFMLWFLCVAELRVAAAVFGAFAFAFSGWVASHLQNTPLVATVIWIPLGFAGLERLHRSGGRRGTVALGLGAGMPWLAGFPQFAALGNLALAAYAGVCVVAHGRAAGGRAAVRRALLLAGCVFAGWLIAGVQLAPTVEAMGYAARGSRSIEDLVSERFRAPALLGLALPRALGEPEADTDWRAHPLAHHVLGEGESGTPPQVTNWGERTVYAGVIVLLLAAYGALHVRQRVALALLVILMLGVTLAGSASMIRIYGRLPGFDFGAPARAILLTAVALPALAAVGLHYALAGGLRARATALVLLSSAACAAAGAWLASPHSGLQVDLAVLAVCLGFGAAAQFSRPRPHVLASMVVFGAVADLLVFFVPVNLPVRKDRLFESTPALDYLATHLDGGRIVRVSETAAAAVADRLDLLHPNLALLVGLDDAQGYRELVPEHALALWRGLPALETPIGFTGLPAANVDSRVLDVAAVRYLIAARQIPALAPRQVHPLAGDGDLWVYANPDVGARVWIALRAVVVNDDEAGRRIRAGAVHLPDEVLVDRVPQGCGRGVPAPSAARHAQLVRDDGDELVVDLVCGGPCYLVVADTWFPGWEARAIDRSGSEHPLEIARAMGCQRVVAVDGEVARVVFRYRPWSVVIGLTASIAGMLAMVIAGVLGNSGLLPAARSPPADR